MAVAAGPLATSQPAATTGATGEVLLWLGVILLLLGAGAAAIAVVRRLAGRRDLPAGGFTLQQLRELRDSGALTEQEYERARDAVIGRLSERPQDEVRTDARSGAGGPGEGANL
jgi:hypothetical protein